MKSIIILLLTLCNFVYANERVSDESALVSAKISPNVYTGTLTLYLKNNTDRYYRCVLTIYGQLNSVKKMSPNGMMQFNLSAPVEVTEYFCYPDMSI